MTRVITVSILSLGMNAAFGQTTLTESSGLLNVPSITTATSSGQSFYIAHQLGYGYYTSLPMFSAITDNTNGANNIFYNGVTNGTTTFSVNESGQGYFANGIGIGTTTPGEKLTVNGAVAATNGISYLYPNAAYIDYCASCSASRFLATGPNNSTFGVIKFVNTTANASGYLESMTILGNGNVLIGQATQQNSAYKLDVQGNIRANSVVINTTGADFVFVPRYKLMPLHDLGRYVNQNHHLPGIEPAKDMQAKGMDLGENQTKLLQKVEELTLYLMDKDKQIYELQSNLN
jgi:hypothetical protein